MTLKSLPKFFDEKFVKKFHKSLTLCDWKGVIFSGEIGVGKTHFIRHFFIPKYKSDFSTIRYVKSTNIFQETIGKSEGKLNKIFKSLLHTSETSKHSTKKSLLIFDDFDIIAKRRHQSNGRIENIMVSELLNCFEILNKKGHNYVVLGITSFPQNLDDCLFKYGKFETTVEMRLPSKEMRKSIANYYTKKMEHEKGLEMVKYFVQNGNGMTISDVINGIRDWTLNKTRPKPTLLQNYTNSFQKIYFKDLICFDYLIKNIKVSIIDPHLHPKKFKSLGINAPKGVLLYGPPGCGKTTLARAIATEIQSNFISIQCSEIISKVVGESSRKISQLFRIARSSSPCVLFFDQFETIARKRYSSHHSIDQMLSTLLIEMDGVNSSYNDTSVIVLAATNRIDMLDAAILRPGRIDMHVMIPMPNKNQIEELWKQKTKHIEFSKNIKKENILKRLYGKSIADVQSFVQRMIMNSIRDDINNMVICESHIPQ